MIDKYIILNRNPKILMRIFIYNIIFITVLIIWCINGLSYQNYFLIHSQIVKSKNYYLVEALIPVKEVKEITSKNNLWINNKKYIYKVIKKNNKVIYQNKKNYIKLYLEINNLEKEYQIDGYHIDIQIKKNKEEK